MVIRPVVSLTVVAGYGVVIVKNGQRICGTGAALANAPIVQNKAYFEAKLQSSGKVVFFCVITSIANLHFCALLTKCFYFCALIVL